MLKLKKLNLLLNEKIQNSIDNVIEEESSRLQKILSGKKSKVRIFDMYNFDASKSRSNYFPASLVRIWCSADFSFNDDIEYHFSAEFSYKNPKNGQTQIETIDDLAAAFDHGKIKIASE